MINFQLEQSTNYNACDNDLNSHSSKSSTSSKKVN